MSTAKKREGAAQSRFDVSHESHELCPVDGRRRGHNPESIPDTVCTTRPNDVAASGQLPISRARAFRHDAAVSLARLATGHRCGAIEVLIGK